MTHNARAPPSALYLHTAGPDCDRCWRPRRLILALSPRTVPIPSTENPTPDSTHSANRHIYARRQPRRQRASERRAKSASVFFRRFVKRGRKGVQTFTWKVSADTVATVAHTRVATRRTLVQILRGELTALSDAHINIWRRPRTHVMPSVCLYIGVGRGSNGNLGKTDIERRTTFGVGRSIPIFGPFTS